MRKLLLGLAALIGAVALVPAASVATSTAANAQVFWGGPFGFGFGFGYPAYPYPYYRTYPAYPAYPPYATVYPGYAQPWTPAWYSYCASRYRSFNPRTGLYKGYDGKYHLCT